MPVSEPSEARTIFIAEVEQFGGAERSVLALAGWLYRHNLPHCVITYIDHCNLAQYATHPVEVIELRPGAGVHKKIGALRRHFKETRAGALKPLLSGYQPSLHATLAGIHGFHTLMHDTPALFSDRETRSLRGKLRIAASNAIAGYGLRGGGQTIVTSEYLRSECRRDFGVNATVVRMGGMAAPSRPRIRIVERELRMLSVSRVEANKRVDWILKALASIEARVYPLSSRVDWRLDVVGTGSLIPALTEMATSLGIGARVHFHGFLADSELAAMYESAHLFLMPAIQGYGIPAIESLERGIPVLLHRDSGVSDILLETPWATVMLGPEPEMMGALRLAIDKVVSGAHHNVPLPELPAEDMWAEQVASLCGWL